jgi:hypothetical protein
MIALVGVACACASDTVGSRRLVGRHMTTATDRVAWHGVQSRKGRRRVTARTRWRRRDSFGAVRTMASRAAAGDRRVDSSRFAPMARRTCGHRLARMRVVALLTTLMAGRRARLLLCVTRPTRGRLCGSVRDGCSVTRCARLVSRVGGREGHLPRMTRGTQSLSIDRRKGVWPVAPFASDPSRMGTCVNSSDLRMTACASRSD